MSSATVHAADVQPPAAAPRVRRNVRSSLSLLSQGEPMLWVTGGALALCALMIVGLIGLVLYNGFSTFWPGPLVQLKMVDGKKYLGEVTRVDRFRPTAANLARLTGDARQRADAALHAHGGWAARRLLRTGNYELTNEHFTWVSAFEIAPDGESTPREALLLERLTWGRFYGFPKAFSIGEKTQATEPAELWRDFQKYHPQVRARWAERRRLETNAIGDVNRRLEEARLALRSVEMISNKSSPEYTAAEQRFGEAKRQADADFARIRQEIAALNAENARYTLKMTTADGQEATLHLADIVRAYQPNQLGLLGKLSVYLARWREFLADDPREANSEGGVFPAIFGTLAMTVLMSLVVSPCGLLAALYLREYAKAGVVVSAVRIAVNNLAGVPSIVFGVFGLGFFCYIVGASIDQVFFSAKLPSPTFGTGGILWASFTLSLLTLPVVIVATEEALAAVPRSMREGSYACGASKWQTIQRVVLPRALPGIMTGMILAMARGAGEVAPLMLVGAVKMAPALPLDRIFPYIHPERSFMHLGFHIYDLGFQSQNSEAAKPMVFTTTLLLVVLIALLNVAAIWLRNRLRRRFTISQF